jgi:hypothetical protein
MSRRTLKSDLLAFNAIIEPIESGDGEYKNKKEKLYRFSLLFDVILFC